MVDAPRKESKRLHITEGVMVDRVINIATMGELWAEIDKHIPCEYVKICVVGGATTMQLFRDEKPIGHVMEIKAKPLKGF